MEVEVTRETYVIYKVLKILEDSRFPTVNIGFIDGNPILVFRYGSEVYVRNIFMNSESATLRDLIDVSSDDFKASWQTLTFERSDKIIYLEEFVHLVDEDILNNNFVQHIDL